MKGTEIHYRSGRQFAIWQARLHDEIYQDPSSPNPILWFMEEHLKDPTSEELYGDMLCGGVNTKRECLETIDQAMMEIE